MGYKDQEKQKEYNKQYFEANKGKVSAKLQAKEACKCCGRVVSHQNLTSHMKTNYCKSKRLNKLLDTLPVYDSSKFTLTTNIEYNDDGNFKGVQYVLNPISIKVEQEHDVTDSQ
jgi:hypothetical protein